jgi:hypothetical protein
MMLISMVGVKMRGEDDPVERAWRLLQEINHLRHRLLEKSLSGSQTRNLWPSLCTFIISRFSSGQWFTLVCNTHHPQILPLWNLEFIHVKGNVQKMKRQKKKTWKTLGLCTECRVLQNHYHIWFLFFLWKG